MALFILGGFLKNSGNIMKPFFPGRLREISVLVARLGFPGKSSFEIVFCFAHLLILSISY
jgi:hypothetical protein